MSDPTDYFKTYSSTSFVRPKPNPRRCPKCNTTIAEGASHCYRCGARGPKR